VAFFLYTAAIGIAAILLTFVVVRRQAQLPRPSQPLPGEGAPSADNT
jgi:hypothetical protein